MITADDIEIAFNRGRNFGRQEILRVIDLSKYSEITEDEWQSDISIRQNAMILINTKEHINRYFKLKTTGGDCGGIPNKTWTHESWCNIRIKPAPIFKAIGDIEISEQADGSVFLTQPWGEYNSNLVIIPKEFVDIILNKNGLKQWENVK